MYPIYTLLAELLAHRTTTLYVTGLWLAGSEGVQKNMETTIMGLHRV